MNTNPQNFSTTHLPIVNKQVFRMGIAGNYGLSSADIEWAAEQGANYWVWGRSYSKTTDGIKRIIQADREKHIIALLGWGYFGLQIRASVENNLRKLKTDYLDVFKLGWLGRTSLYNASTIKELVQLKKEGKIKAIGTSIHNRKRAGKLAQDSEIDLFMIRYNAKHTGAEEDIFPYLKKRNPALISYTALAWKQLIRPLQGISIEKWPGTSTTPVPPLTPELCYRFVLTNLDVHVVLTGPQNREQLQNNFNALKQGPLNADEMDWIRAYGRIVKSKKKLDYIA